jgi:ATP-dependent metalloprotease FtsH
MSEDKKEQRKPQPLPGGGDKRGGNFYWIYAILAIILIGMMIFNSGSDGRQIDYRQFKQYAESGFIEKVEYNQVVGKIYLDSLGRSMLGNEIGNQPVMKGFNRSSEFWFNIPPSENAIDEIERLGNERGIAVHYKPINEFGQNLLFWIIGFGIIIGVWVILMRRMGGGGAGGGQIFSIGKSKAQLFEKGKGTSVTFNDVAGLEGAKQEVQEIVDFLKNPKKYTELGAKIPKGALLVGPPGTGKTLLAKAVAGEAQVPFFSLSGSDFVEMFVGVGASRVRDLFRQAKEKAPSIIFIDEIDAIGRARSKSINFGSNDERENTLNQLLTEMDGFATNSGIIILAATNRADILDKALLRAGRFDRQIYVDMPDLNERVQIFNVHLKNVKFESSIDVEFLARQTPGFSGADIANICNESALIAARKGKQTVDKQDFLDAVDRIIGGLEKKNKIITAEEKSTIAYHESGHAMISWLLEHASPLVKVTIVPRGRSLGAAWYLPEERQITTTEQIFDEMCAALGGRAAEEVAFGKISTGALSDLEKVTKQAYAMVSVYGLNKKIGHRSYYDSSGESQFTKPYSEETARVIDEEVSKIIEKAYLKSVDLLTSHREQLDRLAQKLLEKEVIFKDDLEEILGPRQWKERNPANELKPAIDANPGIEPAQENA